jgi:hypothetical protein
MSLNEAEPPFFCRAMLPTFRVLRLIKLALWIFIGESGTLERIICKWASPR